MWRVTWLVVAYLAVMATGGPMDTLAFSKEPQDMVGRAGEVAELECEVVGGGRGDQATCTWMRGGVEVKLGNRVSQAGCSLVFSPLLVEDEGLYRCRAGALESREARVEVQAQPGLPYIAQARRGDVVEVKQGEAVTLECTSLGARPAAELVWRYGKVATRGFDIREDVTRLEDGRTWKTSSVFKFVPEEDMEVVCSAHSDAFPTARDSRPLRLKLVYKPRVTVEADATHLREGQAVTFTCTAMASPMEVAYKWFINDNELAGQTEASLTLENVGRELDKAKVKCKASNKAGEGEGAVEVEVMFEPKMVVQPQSVVAREGEEVELECLAEGSPAPEYAWVRLVDDKEDVVGVSNTLTLTATDKTEGTYVCKVFVKGQTSINSRPARVEVLRAPGVEVAEVVRARMGEAAVLDCKVTTLSSNTSVVWTRHPEHGRLDSLRGDMTRQRVVKTDSGITIHSELILPTLEPTDFTTYGCFAQNEAGSDYRMVVLEERVDTNWVTLIISINTLLGLAVLAGVLVWHYRKRVVEQDLLPRVARPPIYKGEEDLDTILLNSGAENYGAISNEYFDNTEKKIDLRIV